MYKFPSASLHLRSEKLSHRARKTFVLPRVYASMWCKNREHFVFVHVTLIREKLKIDIAKKTKEKKRIHVVLNLCEKQVTMSN